MAADNQVVLVGNLTDDPELRITPSGVQVASFRLAVTPRVKDGDTWKDGETSFIRVNVWRQQAENLADSMGKGARAIVIGRLKTRSWETPDGDKRSVTEVEADELGPSLKFTTASLAKSRKVGDLAAAAKPSGQFNDEPPF